MIPYGKRHPTALRWSFIKSSALLNLIMKTGIDNQRQPANNWLSGFTWKMVIKYSERVCSQPACVYRLVMQTASQLLLL